MYLSFGPTFDPERAQDLSVIRTIGAVIIRAMVPTLLLNVAFFLLFNATHAPLALFRFDQRPTPPELLRKEVRRYLTSLLIGACVEAWAIVSAPSWPRASASLAAIAPWMSSAAGVVGLSAVAVVVADLHFYVMHRGLHAIPVLMRRVHKVHHESFRPNVFSGLSFHPLEAAAYFSAVPFAAALFCPLPLTPAVRAWAFALGKAIADTGPIFGHVAAGGPAGQWEHYLHHTRGTVNFGGSTLFDRLLGTYAAKSE